MLSMASAQLVSALIAEVDPAVASTVRGRLSNFLNDLDDLPAAPRGSIGYAALREVADLIGPGTGAAASEGDHDYGDWHRLARSAWFNWADIDRSWSALAAAPRYWATAQVLAEFGPTEEFRLAEVGAGTARLTHDIRACRPNVSAWVGDNSLGSLVLAAVLSGGTQLDLPRRTSFEAASAGIAWFRCGSGHVPAGPVRFECASFPDEGDQDVIMALNCLSLYPDPFAALIQLVERLRPGGLLVFADLFCWRVETPAARQVLGPDAVADFLTDVGCIVERRVRGIPYMEDWGFERTYQWSSHGLLVRRETR